MGIIGLSLLPFALLGANPVYWFVATFLARNLSWGAALVAIAATLIANAAGSVACAHLSTSQAARRFLRSKLAKAQLRRLELEALGEIVPDTLRNDLEAHDTRSSPLLRRAGVRQVGLVRLYFVDGPVPAGAPLGSAFVGTDGLRIVVLRDAPPRAAEATAWDRFVLLHELAHVSSEGAALHLVSWRFVFSSLNTLVVVSLLAPATTWWALAAICAALIWSLLWRLHFDTWFETYADMQAFEHLPDDKQRGRALDLFERQLNESTKCFGVQSPQTLHWRARLASLQSGRNRSLFNQAGGVQGDPSTGPLLVASMASAYAGWHATMPGWPWLLAFGVWCIACQLAAAIAFLFGRAWHAEVERSSD